METWGLREEQGFDTEVWGPGPLGIGQVLRKLRPVTVLPPSSTESNNVSCGKTAPGIRGELGPTSVQEPWYLSLA